MNDPDDLLKPFKIRTTLERWVILQCKNKQHARERFDDECKRDNRPETIISIEKVT